jgi:terminase small subunit-like protein
MRWEDDLLEIADDGRNDWVEKRNAAGEVIGWTVNGEHIQRSRARLETRKWLMSKRAPKRYGDKIEQTIAGDPDKPIEAVQRTYRFVWETAATNVALE